MTAPTLDQLRAQAHDAHRAAVRRRDAAARDTQAIIGVARGRPDGMLTRAEADRAAGLRQIREQARATVTETAAMAARLDELAAEEAGYVARSRQTYPSAQPVPETRIPGHDMAAIGYEARTYRKDTDPHGVGFLRDVLSNYLNRDPGATDRLTRHIAEERVERPGWEARAAGDTNTGNWAGLTVPQYLVDLVAPQISALRPFADAATVHYPLPASGMALDISRVTTGTSVALQTNELSAISATTADDTLLTVPVQTAAGMQNVSRQAVERGTGIDTAVMTDLLRKHATCIDSTLINQATTGVSALAQTVTYTSASPTAAEIWPYLMQGSSKVEQALMGVAPPTHVIMHTRRFNWLASQVSNSWPFIGNAPVPPQMGGMQLTTEYGPAVRAVLSNGTKVVVDNNVPVTAGAGTQDELYVVAGDESFWLAEDPNAPIQIRAEQPNLPQLGILLVVYSYFAYWTRYTNAVAKIVGTGTIAPPGF